VVIGWAKFAKAESLTNILDFLEAVYLDTVVNPSQITFALTKHVLYFVMLLQVEDGKNGRTQHDLLLIHTTTSIM
jgi:hypothetical protein